MPLALIIIAAVFLPIYRRLNVYTAYEFLGRRFDAKTRLLGAALFLVQRGLAAGITIYAPAIILSTVLGWRLDLTIILSGLLVIVYTVTGGSEAVSLTQKYQMAMIFGGMVAAFVILLMKLPTSLVTDALTVAGGFHKLDAVDFSFDVNRRYTFWSGLLGGFFLSLSYFGTDQSQVQRYLSGVVAARKPAGADVQRRAQNSRCSSSSCCSASGFCLLPVRTTAGLFQPGRLASGSQARFRRETSGARTGIRRGLRAEGTTDSPWLDAKHAGDPEAEVRGAGTGSSGAGARANAVRAEAKTVMQADDPGVKSNDADYVFVTFILDHLPHGLIGLLIAAFFAAALQSKAAELNALGSTTTIDFYRHLVKREASDAHYVAASKWFTLFWGLVALAFALVCEPGGKPDSGRQHRRLGFLRRGAGIVSGGVFSEAGRRHGDFLGGAGGPGAGLRPLFFTEHQLPLV